MGQAERSMGRAGAVWTSFARQGAWKNWVLAGLLVLNILQALLAMGMANKPPEYVLVDSDGKTSFVKRAVATDALLTFLADRTKPPDLTVVRFTKDFLERAVAINSSTIEQMWPAALAMMNPVLRQKVDAEAKTSGVLEMYKMAKVRSKLRVEDLTLVASANNLRQIRATVVRERSPLNGDGVSGVDKLGIEMVLAIVPPTVDRPDGLEVAAWEIRDLAKVEAPTTAAAGPPAAGK